MLGTTARYNLQHKEQTSVNYELKRKMNWEKIL